MSPSNPFVQILLPDPPFEDIWRTAIREYEKNANVALPANLNSVDDALCLVDEKLEEFSEFSNQRRLRPNVTDVLRVVDLFSGAVEARVGVVS